MDIVGSVLRPLVAGASPVVLIGGPDTPFHGVIRIAVVSLVIRYPSKPSKSVTVVGMGIQFRWVVWSPFTSQCLVLVRVGQIVPKAIILVQFRIAPGLPPKTGEELGVPPSFSTRMEQLRQP